MHPIAHDVIPFARYELNDRSELLTAPLKRGCAVALYCLVHSALASPRAKRAAARQLGATASDKLHRAMFNVPSVAGFAVLVLGFLHEEARLKAKHKDAYDCYVRPGVPFYLPDFRRLTCFQVWTHEPK